MLQKYYDIMNNNLNKTQKLRGMIKRHFHIKIHRSFAHMSNEMNKNYPWVCVFNGFDLTFQEMMRLSVDGVIVIVVVVVVIFFGSERARATEKAVFAHMFCLSRRLTFCVEWLNRKSRKNWNYIHSHFIGSKFIEKESERERDISNKAISKHKIWHFEY